MFVVDPYGDVRDDLRAAVNTANLLAAQSAEKVTPEEFNNTVRTLANYCEKTTDETSVEFNPQALAMITKGAT